MRALRLHHRDYFFLWDLVDLWRSAFHNTGPLTSPALLPLPVPDATPAERASERLTGVRA